MADHNMARNDRMGTPGRPFLRGSFTFIALGILLGLPSLWGGWFLDDLTHRSAFQGVGVVSQFMTSPARMFTFTSGDLELNRGAIESGFFPWWTAEDILLDFWRPVTVLTHVVDDALWAEQAMLMHAQSLGWYCVAIVLAMVLYRRLGGGGASAGLSTLLFVVDEAHAMPVAWLANRNALLGLVLGLLCLVLHHRWRDEGGSRGAVLAGGALALALLANEGALAVLGYLVGYALFLEKGAWRVRALSLVPYAAIVLVWRLAYRAMGFGALGSEVYVDPGVSPVRFLVAAVARIPVLLAAQLTNLPAEPFHFHSPAGKVVHWTVALVLSVGTLFLLRRVLRESALAKFWGLGMLLSLVPAAATFPAGRLLVFAGIGGAALLAELLASLRSSHARLLTGLFGGLHLVVAPLVFLLVAAGLGVGSRAMGAAFTAQEYPAEVENRVAFIVDSPNYFVPTYSWIYRELHDLPVPAASHALSSNRGLPVRVVVERPGERTLRVAPDGGFPFFLFRDTGRPFAPGDEVDLENFDVVIQEVDRRGQPLVVDYEFPRALEAESYLWLQMDGALSFAPFALPEVGERRVFERQRLSSASTGRAARETSNEH